MDIETPAVDAVAAVDVIPAVNEEVPAAIAPPTVSDVFPNGDIYLVCGSNYGDRLIHKIRVSSAILNLSSKVFQAMLSPRFKEGTDLLEATSASPLEIELADDDPQAMEAVCDIVHLRNAGFAATCELAPYWILRIALVADKYDFITAMKLVSGMWLNNVKMSYSLLLATQLSFPEADTSHLMLAASYLFRNGKTFREYGKKLLLDCTSDISAPMSHSQLEPVRDVLIILERERIKYQQQLIKIVESEIQKCLLLRKTPGVAVCGPACNYAGEFTLMLMENLQARSLWPVSSISVRPLQHSLSGFTSVRATNPLVATRVCDTKNCTLAKSLCHDFGNPQWIKGFLEISTRIKGEIKGPCLRCFVEDGKVEIMACNHPRP